MAIKKELIITINSLGEIEIETRGLKGSECEEEIKPLENSLGKVSQRKRTAEFYEKAKTKIKVGSSTK